MKNEIELNLFEFNENDNLEKNDIVYFDKETLIKVLDDLEQINKALLKINVVRKFLC